MQYNTFSKLQSFKYITADKIDTTIINSKGEQNMVNFDNINLYLLKNVQITFSDGICASGMLKSIQFETNEVRIDDVVYPLNSISDLEMIGAVTYHTYFNDERKACDIDGLYFSLDDFISGTDYSPILYGEFNCHAACHLVFNEAKICAKDVRILSLSHKIYESALSRSPYIYILRDVAPIIGKLQNTETGYIIQTLTGASDPINFAEVLDIIRIPATNESVIITVKDGTTFTGTVSAANDDMVVLIDNSVQVIKLVDIITIRYKGIVTASTIKLPNGTVKQIKISLGSKDETFLCKIPYFHTVQDETAAVDGVMATFIPGVTDRGLIAKDVVIDSQTLIPEEEKYETGIIVIAPTQNRTIGYIGQEFVTKTYSLLTHSSMPRGNVTFTVDQLSFRINPRYIYIVRYSYNDQDFPLKAKKIELKEYYPLAEYAKIWIDTEGGVHKLPISVLYLDKFVNHPVDIWLSAEELISGNLVKVDDSEVHLTHGTEQITIKAEDIARVFYSGIVTAYQPNNGTGFINGQYWFHVNNFSDKDHILRLEVGSSVKYTFEVSTKGNMCAATNIELAESSEKRGYILKYITKHPGKGFGFIIAPEFLEDRLRRNDKSGTIYFRESDIENPAAFNIDTNKFYYSVAYTAGDNNTAYNVKILEEHPFKPKATPKLANIPTKKRIETKALSDFVGSTDSAIESTYEYGLINIFSSHYALINPQYYNRDYEPDGVYDVSKTVCFNPDEAIIAPDPHLKTGKFTYLVRYVQKGSVINESTGTEQPTIDYSYPVEVICSFSKKQCASILLSDQSITIEYIEGIMPNPIDIPKVSDDSDDAPEFMLGESIYFKFKDGSVCHGIYSGENDETYVLTNGTHIEKSAVTRLFRFGVITALSLESGTATINNSFDFSLSVAEPKMVSILRNQKNLVRLHIMYSCTDGKISEVCRISKRCYSCLSWDAGFVTDFDNQVRKITIDSSINHYLTVLSDGVNGYVNNGSILNRAVFVKQVFHPFLEGTDMEPEIVAMAVDVRCQEEELRIQYDDGKDVFLGYRNATLSFPILGSARVLAEKTGETVMVSFRVGADMTNLEGYIDDNSDTPTEISELVEEEYSAKIQQEALSLLLLQREDTEQLIAGKIHPGADGKLSDQSQVQNAVHFLISKSKHLAAIKIAMQYPEYDILANTDNLLRSEIQTRCTSVGLDANSYYGEQAFYLSTALQYPSATKAKGRSSSNKYSKYDFLYRLFLQDFESREHLVKYIQMGNPATMANLSNLFRKPCLQVGELVAHVVVLDKLNLNTICSVIRHNKQLSDSIISYAKEIDDMISGQDVSEVIQAVQERYLRDKRRFTDRVIGLVGTDNVCENLKTLISNMQSRFLRLICKDDRLRFERLMKICSDVLDYTNKPGFSQQEQLLRHCYREISLLEEDILTHPCRESVEILLSSGRFDTVSNILVSVKKNIYALLNRLYQGATTPRIHCRVNETSIHPNARTFWLIIENGSQNDNLQPAENLHIELEPFTLGFMPQSQVRLSQNQIACGDQIAVEVEFELSENTSKVLEFGWVARYEYTTEFQNNGSTTKSAFQQESEHPIQLQIDTTLAYHKDYNADNPYFDPARGQPLVGKEMFFGRKTEMKKILESICTQAEEKRFIPGSAVIIHGQKKSGKTSLVNQIKNYIKEDDVLSNKAIILNFSNILDETGGVELLHCFKRTFYAVIMSRFEDEVCENHPDVVEKMNEIGLEVPDLLSAESESIWSVKFDKFFRDFYKMDGGKHNVILFMDEFTLLCTTILSEIERCPEKAFLNNIPNFIKTFSQYGFVQIIIGHEAMMRALDTLGVLNHTAEFAKSIEISALDDTASRSLVALPMQSKFGYDVYGSELGMQAVERLLDLSGRNPAYLMRLCNKMFMYYTDPEKCPRTQLLLSDVNTMVQDYTGELLLSDFDILLREDGDDTVEAEKRITYHYLKCAALRSLTSYDKRTADSSEITRELSREYAYAIEEIEKTRNILEARRVISITNGGRVKINTGLFSEYIQQKNGLK